MFDIKSKEGVLVRETVTKIEDGEISLEEVTLLLKDKSKGFIEYFYDCLSCRESSYTPFWGDESCEVHKRLLKFVIEVDKFI